MIVGSREFIERCRSIRKMLGGGMRQAGVLAAAGLVALENGPKRLQIDHDNAKFLAGQLASIPGITLKPAKVQTNIVIFDVKKSGWSSGDSLKALAKRGVLAVPVDDDRVRMVTHLDVDRAPMSKAARGHGLGEVLSAMKKIRVGVILGGRSGEHEVSLRSAESILNAIDRDKYDVVPITITHEGRWEPFTHFA